MFCSGCGNKNESNAKFCSSCGKEMTESSLKNALKAKQNNEFKLNKLHVIGCLFFVMVIILGVFAFNRSDLEREIIGRWELVGVYNADGEFMELVAYDPSNSNTIRQLSTNLTRELPVTF